MEQKFTDIIAGCGFAGAVLARALADKGARVLILEKRAHIAGNAYDCLNKEGIVIHQYGPHIFHTNHDSVYQFLSRFTEWNNYQHKVCAFLHGRLVCVPFNFLSIRAAFPDNEADHLCKKLENAYGKNQKVSVLQLRENEDSDLRHLGDFVYENIFRYYTQKQWGTPAEEVDASVLSRVPVYTSEEERYFTDRYQGMPRDGYTALFHRMLDHKNITVCLSCDFKDRVTLQEGKIFLDGEPFLGDVTYTGAIDALLDYAFGRLPYRTLRFQFETKAMDYYQPVATINYTVSEDYTRITEFKSLTGQIVPGVTTILKEYPLDFTGAADQEPYYPVIKPESEALYKKYCEALNIYPKLHLLGRLAQYRYYNMDAIAFEALKAAQTILKSRGNV